jgi:hypothetical protein
MLKLTQMLRKTAIGLVVLSASFVVLFTITLLANRGIPEPALLYSLQLG